MSYRPLLLAGLCGLLTVTAAGADLGFVEDFALTKDRRTTLQQLIPGSEDYYYYHALYWQQNQQFEKVEELFQPWQNQHGPSARLQEIRLRQALLTYDRNPRQSLETIRRQLQLEFQHQREKLGEKPNLPTQLDEQLLARQRLKDLALANHANLEGFEDAALDWLVTTPLDPDRRRSLLQRLQRPGYDTLPRLIADDLNHPQGVAFGSHPIHRQLLLAELDALLKLKPDLLNQQQFVHTYLLKLAPSADVDWRRNAEVRGEYLTRLWSFVSRLAPVHNSLKAHVLYHWLAHDRERGVYDRERFMTYLQLPRQAPYVSVKYLELEANRRFLVDLAADFLPVTGLPPIGNDEPLIRDYLQQFLIDENTTKPFEPFLEDSYLRQVFAETKILHGLGNPEQWYALVPPEWHRALKDRVDLEFLPTNRRQFAVDEPVAIDLWVKNVETLIVNVFEINTKNFYRQQGREVNTDINLDGLVANEQQTHRYSEPPLRRVKRHFEFPSLQAPGVYVIDFIGNGKSSRVVVQKGSLRHLVRTGTAGHVFTLLNERDEIVRDGTVWLAGHEYTANQDGKIIVPFSQKPGPQKIVLAEPNSGRCTLSTFEHEAENYGLEAAMYVDRENLLARRTAEGLVRPTLRMNGVPVSLKVLEQVKLTVVSQDLDGVRSTKEFSPFPLAEDREATFEFHVPARLASLTMTLSAKVQNHSQNKKVDLQTSTTINVNSIETTNHIEDLYLAQIAGGYVLELLGKSGEAKPDRAVQVSLKHRDFRDPVQVTLKSDERGRIALGNLAEIESVTATGPEGTVHTWPLTRDRHTQYSSVHGVQGQPVQIPFMGGRLDRDSVSFLELRQGTFFADRFADLTLENGVLIAKDLRPGDYDLWLKRIDRRIHVRITDGQVRESYALGDARFLELRDLKPLQIASLMVEPQAVRIQLANANPFTRVHLFATRYEPEFRPFERFNQIRGAELKWKVVPPVDSLYMAGRNIGDEYQYILDRRLAPKYPGVMLDRPGVLLNPWAVRTTETERQVPQDGTDFAPAAAPPHPADPGSRPAAAGAVESKLAAITSNYDFLATTSQVLVNLVPDEQGQIVIPRDALQSRQFIHVLAVDPVQTAYRQLSLPEVPLAVRDLRLAVGLDPKQHYTQQKLVTVKSGGEPLKLDPAGNARFEVYDSLQRLYGLYATLCPDPKVQEFSFVVRWPSLPAAEQRELYSKYACHELHFFLFRKDPKFFQEVVRPYLANKHDKTFLDRWLLELPVEDDLDPWAYHRLNIFERILLAQRIERDAEYGERHVRELLELQPPDVQRATWLFRTALRGSVLEKSEAVEFGLPKLQDSRRQLGVELGDMMMGGMGGAEVQSAELDAARDEKLGRRADRMNRFGRKESLEKLHEESRLNAYLVHDKEAGKAVRQLFRPVDQTKEWAENNYYQLPIEQQDANLITVNAFWQDVAAWDPSAGKPFFSTHFPEASRNFTEVMLALALLDLPFQAGEPKIQRDESGVAIESETPVIVVHEEIRRADAKLEKSPILISQNYFQANDRYRHENNERLDKFVSDEFLIQTVYGCQVVVTNPTSSPQKLNLLLQIPVGSIPVQGAEMTRGVNLQLDPFGTQTVEYFFYFPAAGKVSHFPVHVAKDEQLVGFADPVTLTVVTEPSRVDRTSWEYVSQHGTDEEVLEFLRKANLQRLDLDRIAFRMQERSFFLTATELLAKRHAYNHTLWSYSLKHDVPPAIRQYLRHADQLVEQIGEYLESPLLEIDPVERRIYQQLEYMPLVNARAHPLGKERKILNDRFAEQYQRLMKILGYKRELNHEDRLEVAYYLLLQDRVEEATDFFRRVEEPQIAARLQYDYFAAYLSLCHNELEAAEQIATQYADYPVHRWRDHFRAVSQQIDEARGAAPAVLDPENRQQTQTQLAATQPNLELTVEGTKVRVRYQNVRRATVNYYLMDLELLFSRNPFVRTQAEQFAAIRPNESQELELPADQSVITFELPEALRRSNVLVEVRGAGQSQSQPFFANTLTVQLLESYGQVRAVSASSGGPLPKVYVKVYAQHKDGSVRFYKDGYTDLRGRFEYASLNTNELDFVQRFAILVLSDEHGAVVREAATPQR